MAELADALDSGSSESNFMQVQVLFPAPENDKFRQKLSLYAAQISCNRQRITLFQQMLPRHSPQHNLPRFHSLTLSAVIIARRLLRNNERHEKSTYSRKCCVRETGLEPA